MTETKTQSDALRDVIGELRRFSDGIEAGDPSARRGDLIDALDACEGGNDDD